MKDSILSVSYCIGRVLEAAALLFIMECLHKMVMQSDDMRNQTKKTVLHLSWCLHLMSHLGSIGQILTGGGNSNLSESIRKRTCYASQWRVPWWRWSPLLTVSRKNWPFRELEKDLKSNQGVKGLKILSFDKESWVSKCESCPLVRVFLCLY